MNEIYESNRKKYVFYRKKIDFLNYIIERNEIRIDSIKFQIIKN